VESCANCIAFTLRILLMLIWLSQSKHKETNDQYLSIDTLFIDLLMN